MTAEYRCATSKYQKVCILISPENLISVQKACLIVKMSTKTYYKTKAAMVAATNKLTKRAPNQLLTDKEEMDIIETILKAQICSDCMSGKDVRYLAQKLFFDRTKEEREFDRKWFYSFIERHSDLIGKQKCPSVDDDRGSISLKSINEYIKAVEKIYVFY